MRVPSGELEIFRTVRLRSNLRLPLLGGTFQDHLGMQEVRVGIVSLEKKEKMCFFSRGATLG